MVPTSAGSSTGTQGWKKKKLKKYGLDKNERDIVLFQLELQTETFSANHERFDWAIEQKQKVLFFVFFFFCFCFFLGGGGRENFDIYPQLG